jgi:superfamily II DNA or RNA helicase
MEKLIYTLSRMGASSLSSILGKSTVDLVGSLDLIKLTASSLAELALAKHGCEGILLDKKLRGKLFEAMSLSEGRLLLTALGCLDKGTPLATLKGLSFSPKSPKTLALFNYFGCDYNSKTEPTSGDSTSITTSMYPMFSHQHAAHHKTIRFLLQPKDPRVLLHMPTGAGKTRTAMNVIADLLRTFFIEPCVVIWLAHSEELCDQAAEEFHKAWSILGTRPLTVYRNFADSRINSLDEVTDGILIAGLSLLYNQSLSQSTAFLNLSRRTVLVVMDEAHQAIAPTYKHLLTMLCPTDNTLLLGLSATPGRSFLNAGEDIRLAEFFNRQKVTLEVEGYDNPVQFLQENGYLAKVNTIRLPYSPNKSVTLSEAESKAIENGLDIPPTVLSRLADDQLRNLLIISAVIREVERDNKILVFACSVAHAELLADVLRLKGVKAAAVTSRTAPAERELRISNYRETNKIQVLTNFGVLTTGFDAPKTNVAFICRPTRSVVLYSQMVGRAARGIRAGGNEECRVFTVVDSLPGVKDISEAFTFWEDIWC